MDFDAGVARSRRTIGFGLPSVRMEEEEDQGGSADRLGRGLAEGLPSSSEAISAMIGRLLDERSRIIELLKAKEVEKGEALTLLADNRQLILFLQGGSPYKFATEKVIYSLLIFSGVVIVLL